MVRGKKFVGIRVRDQDVALSFHTRKLGLKVATDQPFNNKQRWIELLIPGAETGVALFTPEGHERVLKFKGVTYTNEPKNESWGAVGIFQGPDGNRFALSSKVNHK